jgi:hypothetical protein
MFKDIYLLLLEVFFTLLEDLFTRESELIGQHIFLGVKIIIFCKSHKLNAKSASVIDL